MEKTNARTAVIAKALDVSTSHITEEDAKLLESSTSQGEVHFGLGYPTIVYSYPEGYFVYAHVGDNAAEVRDFNKACRAAGYSEAFLKVMQMARRNGCKYAQLDCDGIEYPQLKTYKW